MTLFIILVAIAIITSTWILTAPLRQSPTNTAVRRLEAELTSVSQAEAAGTLSEDQAKKQREALLDQISQQLQSKPPPQDKTTMAAIVLILPAVCIGLYLAYGTPQALDPENLAQAADNQQAPTLESAIGQLRQRLQAQPDDIDGWLLLGRSYKSMQQYQQAAEALANAYQLAPQDPNVLVEYGEAIAFSSGQRELPEQALQLINQALSIDPMNQKGLWLTGIAAFQLGRYQEAERQWQKLLAQLPAGDAVAQSVREQIERARQLMGAPALAEQQPENAGASEAAVGIAVDVALSPELASRADPASTVFVFARAESGPPMPLAIRRLQVRDLPTTVVLDDSTSMMPAMKLSLFPRVVIGARVSASGQATPQPGDLQGLSQAVDNTVSQVSITIDQAL